MRREHDNVRAIRALLPHLQGKLRYDIDANTWWVYLDGAWQQDPRKNGERHQVFWNAVQELGQDPTYDEGYYWPGRSLSFYLSYLKLPLS